MIQALKPYPEYKESGVQWLGRIPAHWVMHRLRHVVEMLVSNVDKHSRNDEQPVRLCNYVDVYKNERITECIAFMRATATSDEVVRFRLHAGDVIITKDSGEWTDIGVPSLVEYSAPDLVCGYHLAILRPRKEMIEGAYLLRALQSPVVATQFHVRANGVTRYGLSHEAIKSLLIPVPQVDEQAAIFRFVDWASTRLGRAIRTKRKLIALLNEQKQAIIHRAVTRGLAPNVPLKPSGTPWLGDIPKHWKLLAVKRCATLISKGTTPSTEGKELLDSGPIRFLKAENISCGAIVETPKVFIDQETHNILRRSQLRKNDILFVIAGATLGKIAIVHTEHLPANTNQAVAFIRPNRRVAPEFLALWLQSDRIKEQIWLNAVQSAQPNLSMGSLGNFPVPLPPVDEQALVVQRLDAELSRPKAAIQRIEREITLLREYRIRLVADVVTGKLDVRGADLPAMALVEQTEPLVGTTEVETDEGELVQENANAKN